MPSTRLLALYGLLAVLSFGCSGEQQEMYEGSECQEDGDCETGFTCNQGYCQGGSAVSDNQDAGKPPASIDGGMKVVEASGDATGLPPDLTPVEVETADCKGSSCPIPAGSTVTFRAAVLPGYRFVRWEGDPRCSAPPPAPEITLPDVSENIKCIAVYVKRVTVSGVSDGTGAEVLARSDDPEGSCTGATCEVDANQTVVITASARAGYRFVGFAGAGCERVNGLSVEVIAQGENVTCTATFSRTFEVTGVSTGADTSIVATSDTAFSGCMNGTCVVDEQGAVTLTAPDLHPGYRFAGWTGDAPCTGTNGTLVITPVLNNVACIASYKRRITVTGVSEGVTPPAPPQASSNDPFRECTQAGVCTVDELSDVVLTAQTVPGFRFTEWHGTGCAQTNGSSTSVTGVLENTTCTAVYASGIAVIGNIVGVVNPSAQVTAVSPAPSAQCAGSSCILTGPSDVNLTAPDLGSEYRFVGWEGDAGCSGTTAKLALKSVASSKTCHARFVRRYVISALVATKGNPGDVGGTVKATPTETGVACGNASCTVDETKTVVLEAIAGPGPFRFAGWSGSQECTSSRNTISFTNRNISCTANFVRVWNIAAQVGSGGGGTASASVGGVDCASGSCIADQDVEVTLKAIASVPTHQFVRWTGAGTDAQECNNSTRDTLVIKNRAVTCTAVFTPVRRTITVATVPSNLGQATITQPSSGNPACNAAFTQCTVDHGTAVTINAPGSVSAVLTGWSGSAGCEGTASHLVTVDGDKSCTAGFTPARYTLSLALSPADRGSVNLTRPATGNPSCNVALTECTVDYGTQITISAPDSVSAVFSSWSGSTGCAGTASHAVTVDSNKACTAAFTAARYAVTVTNTPAGRGSVSITQPTTGNPACNAGLTQCTVDYGTQVTINAPDSASATFSAWSGTAGCGGAASHSITVDGIKSCSAAFNVARYSLTVGSSPSDRGSATMTQPTSGNPSCNAGLTQCTVDYGTQVTINAPDSASAVFSAWSGSAGCAGAASHAVTVDGTKSCSAAFNVARYSLTVGTSPSGRGSATITQPSSGNPSCNAGLTQCTVDYGTQVTINAPDSASAVFSAWSGSTGCAGAASHAVTVDGTKSCSAAFNVARYSLTVGTSPSGRGSATITQPSSGNPSCNAGLTQCTVDYGTQVTINAPDSASAVFSAWSGSTGCAGAASHAVTVDGAKSCSAAFNVARYSLTVGTSPNGRGSATITQPSSGNPSCNAGLTQCTVDYGTQVTINAPDSASAVFSAWSGSTGCAGAASHAVTVDGTKSCSAAFNVARYSLTVGTSPSGRGSATITQPTSGNPSCNGGLTQCTVDYGTQVSINAPNSIGAVFSAWSGSSGCAGASTHSLTVDGVKTCDASFNVARYTINVATSPSNLGQVNIAQPPAAANPQCNAAMSSCTVDYGAELTLNALDTSNARFNNRWGGDCASTLRSPTITADGAKSCLAEFQQQWRVQGDLTNAPAGASVTISSPNNGSPQAVCTPLANGVNNCQVDNGLSVTVTAPNLTYYVVSGWAGSNCPGGSGRNPTTISFAVSADVTCRPVYTARRVFVTARKESSSAGGTLTVTSQNGAPQCSNSFDAQGVVDGVTCSVNMGSTVTVGVTEDFNSNSRFDSWSTAICGGLNLNSSFVAESTTDCVARFYGLWARGYRDSGYADSSLGATGVAVFGNTIGVSQLYPMFSPNGGPAVAAGRRSVLLAQTGDVLSNTTSGSFDNDGAWSRIGSGGSNAFDIVGPADSHLVLSNYFTVSTNQTTNITTYYPMLIFQNGTETPVVRAMSGLGNVDLKRAAWLGGTDFIAVGNTRATNATGILTRVSSSGLVSWTRATCITNKCGAMSCLPTRIVDVETTQDGFTTLGYSVQRIGELPRNVLLIQAWKLDGTLVAENSFEPVGGDIEPKGLIVTTNNEYVIVGSIVEEQAAAAAVHDAFWVKLSPDLRTVSGTGRLGRTSYEDSLEEVSVSSDGRMLMAAGQTTIVNASTGAATKDAWLVQLDAEKVSVRTQLAYGSQSGNDSESFSDIRSMPVGGYVAVGQRYAEGAYPLVARVDDNGLLAFNPNSGMILQKTGYTADTKDLIKPHTNVCPVYVSADLGTKISDPLQPAWTDPTENYELLAP